MKKIIAVLAALVAALTLASAEVTLGGRGIFGWGVSTTLKDDMAGSIADVDIERAKSLSYGGAVYAKIPLLEVLGVQAELGFTGHSIWIHSEVEVGEETYESDYTASYAAFDFPVLLTYDIAFNDFFCLTPFVGPKLSLPVGKITYHGDVDGDVDVAVKPLWSLVIGANAAFKTGNSAVVVDVRYDVGYSTLKARVDDDDVAFATPRPLLVSIGYQITL